MSRMVVILPIFWMDSRISIGVRLGESWGRMGWSWMYWSMDQWSQSFC